MLEKIAIENAAASAVAYAQGAHLAEWTPNGQHPVLFMSERSAFAPGKAIRGGVPIIFPWFGNRADGQPGPAHGFARTAVWQRVGSDGVIFTLEGEGFEARFEAVPAERLSMALSVRNTSATAFRFEEALHTYFAVSSIYDVSVTGLEGVTYIDKTDGFRQKTEGNAPIRITKETDQVYLNTESACVIHDPGWNRRIVVAKTGSRSTIVWNPWAEKSAGMSDMAPEGWQRMICVESGNAADNAVTLAPGESHTLTVEVTLQPL
jgi:glucose-6-phosphate 1-epimerase